MDQFNMEVILVAVICISVLALIYASSLFSSVKKENSGNKKNERSVLFHSRRRYGFPDSGIQNYCNLCHHRSPAADWARFYSFAQRN